MYISQKFWFDHLFFENHDKINIKKTRFSRHRKHCSMVGVCMTRRTVAAIQAGLCSIKGEYWPIGLVYWNISLFIFLRSRWWIYVSRIPSSAWDTLRSDRSPMSTTVYNRQNRQFDPWMVIRICSDDLLNFHTSNIHTWTIFSRPHSEFVEKPLCWPSLERRSRTRGGGHRLSVLMTIVADASLPGPAAPGSGQRRRLPSGFQRLHAWPFAARRMWLHRRPSLWRRRRLPLMASVRVRHSCVRTCAHTHTLRRLRQRF
jgi:hypothetical protein